MEGTSGGFGGLRFHGLDIRFFIREDWVAYARSNTAVSVNLATGAGSGGQAQGDTLSNIEAVVGSAHNDTLIGDGGSNRIVGQGGADSLDGGGVDELNYFTSSAAVSVNLATGAVSGGHAQGGHHLGVRGRLGLGARRHPRR